MDKINMDKIEGVSPDRIWRLPYRTARHRDRVCREHRRDWPVICRPEELIGDQVHGEGPHRRRSPARPRGSSRQIQLRY